MKRVSVIVALFLVVAVSVAALVLAVRHAEHALSKKACKTVLIDIDRGGNIVYMQERDIKNWMTLHGITPQNTPLMQINASHIETVLRQNHYVRDAQVYTTPDEVLHIDVEQRNPVLKIINTRQQIFQLDENGVEMPVNPDYKARLRVASGYIPLSPRYGSDVTHLSDTSRRVLLKKLFDIHAYLSEDPLWDALFEQIYVNRNQEIDLVPKVGGQIVELGEIKDIDDLAQKMFRLRLFYEQAMKGQDWQRYSVLDLRYKNQLVATRRAGYN